MNKQFFALMLGIAVCATSPVFASMATELEDDYNTNLMKSTGVKKVCEYADGSYDVEITSLSGCKEIGKVTIPTIVITKQRWHTIPWQSTIPVAFFNALAKTGRYQGQNFLYTVENQEAAADFLKIYRKNDLITNIRYLVSCTDQEDTDEHWIDCSQNYTTVDSAKLKVKREQL